MPQNLGVNPSTYGLEHHGLKTGRTIYWNLGPAALYEHAIKTEPCLLANNGALVVRTGVHTGRSPKDKFVVKEPEIESKIWWGSVNAPIEPEKFNALYNRVLAYLQHKTLYVQDLYAGSDPDYRISIRVINEYAWQNLFVHQLFVRPEMEELKNHIPQFTVLAAPGFKAYPELDGVRSDAFVLVDFPKRIILIGGTEYAGEMKKSIFTIMNLLLPERGVLSMHCSANIGKDGNSALFFGLSGTGKTSLSADPNRGLIGDDEHGWSDKGIFNFEGGCYAKAIKLSKEDEPQIYNAIRFGSICENTALDLDTHEIDFDDDSLTENTRVAYPLNFIDNAVIPSVGPHPKDVFFLTCDAFGVLPPISKLTKEQAMEQFLLGYTAKVAGTEKGITEPEATFSACFGAPFLPLPPTVYAKLLGDKLEKHGSTVWLVNTGWTGGPYGVGSRIKIPYTRAMVSAALDGKLNDVEYRTDPNFGLLVPTSCPDVPAELLDPKQTWADKDAYDAQAVKLAGMWEEQSKKVKG